MNELMKQFKFQEHDIRVIDKDGKPWFVAKDICATLGIKNNRQAIKKLDPLDISSVIISDGTSGNPLKTIINESAMYELVLSSRKKNALDFKRWITREVIPAINDHGGYLTPEKAEDIISDPNTAYVMAEALLNERKERIEITEKAESLSKEKNILTEANKELVEDTILKDNTIYHQNEKIVQLKLSDDYLNENVLPSVSLISSTELGTIIGIGSAVKLHRWLASKEVLRWVNSRYVVTAKYAMDGFTRDVSYPYLHSDGVTRGVAHRIMWTEGGIVFVKTLYNLLEGKQSEL